jgi:hypothetical protein
MTFDELIGTWPRGVDGDGRELTSIGTFAADVGIAYYHAQVMKQRRSIGADYWPRVLDAAAKRGVALSEKDLFRMREVLTRERAEEKAAKKRAKGKSRPRIVVGGFRAA